jgi:hypothetical protein
MIVQCSNVYTDVTAFYVELIHTRDGKTNFFLKSANHKSANSWAHSAIANPQIFMIYPQVANLQISTKYCTSLPQNSLKSRPFKKYNLFILFFDIEHYLLYMEGEKSMLFADLRKF